MHTNNVMICDIKHHLMIMSSWLCDARILLRHMHLHLLYCCHCQTTLCCMAALSKVCLSHIESAHVTCFLSKLIFVIAQVIRTAWYIYTFVFLSLSNNIVFAIYKACYVACTFQLLPTPSSCKRSTYLLSSGISCWCYMNYYHM